MCTHINKYLKKKKGVMFIKVPHRFTTQASTEVEY